MSGNLERKLAAPLPSGLEGLASTTLVIGDLARWRAQGKMVPPLEGFQFLDFHELNEMVISMKAPDIILSPLVADEFDAVDIAAKLISYRFEGRYRAIADDVPDASLIRREVRQFAPDLDFDLLLMPRMAGE